VAPAASAPRGVLEYPDCSVQKIGAVHGKPTCHDRVMSGDSQDEKKRFPQRGYRRDSGQCKRWAHHRSALADLIAVGPAELPSGTLESAVLEALPGKKPLIKRSFRPPNFETPVTYFNELFTRMKPSLSATIWSTSRRSRRGVEAADRR